MWVAIPFALAGVSVDRRPTSWRASECGECHTAEHAEWQTSRHAVASTNPTFTASWENWPNGWCLECHAPLEVSQKARLGVPAVAGNIHRLPTAPPGEAWNEGVNCAACHLREGSVLSSRPSPAAPHPITVEPGLSDGSLCQQCHEFTFQNHTPKAPFSKGDTPAQATFSEWQSSNAAAEGTGCVDCHMGPVGHRFPGAHTPSLVKSALRVEVVRRKREVTATLSAPHAPHRIPTGDPFRRLVLEICDDESCENPTVSHTLRRVFAPNETTWELVEDRTLPPETTDTPSVRTWTFLVKGRPRHWRLRYFYGDPQFESQLPAAEVSTTIDEGIIKETP